MAETSWRDRLDRGRTVLQRRSGDLSAGARAAAEGAGARIGEVYGHARSQASHTAAAARDRAGTLGADARELSGEALRRGRDTLDKAAVASRGLIAERPLTAVALGLGAGLILGVLANRLARSRAEPSPDTAEEDEWYQ